MKIDMALVESMHISLAERGHLYAFQKEIEGFHEG